MISLLRNAAKEALQQVIHRHHFYWRMPGDKKHAVCLTFDDGPNPEFTPPLLAMLKEAGVRATFFVVGERVERYPALAVKIVEHGHSIGGHTCHHTLITDMTCDELKADLLKTRNVIKQVTGVDTLLFRPPKGIFSFDKLRVVAGEGYRVVHWSKTYSDYKKDGADALCRRMKANMPAPGDIVLLHDNNPYTLESLARMIPLWQKVNVRFAAF